MFSLQCTNFDRGDFRIIDGKMLKDDPVGPGKRLDGGGETWGSSTIYLILISLGS